jgi:two-component system OmpR family sensor kinase
MVSAIVILLAGLVAALASFGLAYSDARELQDDTLRQIANLSVVRTTAPVAPDTQTPDPDNDWITDRESRVTIYHLPNNAAPAWLKRDLSPGLHTLDTGPEELRVYVSEEQNGRRKVVTQPTEVRDEIAFNSALFTLIPLLLLIPVLAGLIVYIVRNELAPITRLSASLDEQSAERPLPVSDVGLPQEITPFVHAINRLLGRVSLLMSQQRRFIADAAHELRSPLTALSLQAQNLNSAGSIEVMRERVVPLQEGIARARLLTEQLLNLARTQSGESIESGIDVSAMARELVAEILPLAEARHIDLGIEEVAPLSLPADPEALRLILRNALDNAIKYTQDRGKVTLRMLTENNHAVIEVVDNGPGIPVLERDRVFEPFYRINGTDVDGSGLGLAIASEAAARMGGAVTLHEVRDGAGSIFRYRQKLY